MRRSKFVKPEKNLQRKLLLVLAILLVLAVFVFYVRSDLKKGNNDYKIALVSNNKLEMISISPERKMINVLRVDGNVPVWIPNGPGWYRINQMEKILNRNSKNTKDLFFYNFGFVPDREIFSENENAWKNASELIGDLGLVNWISFKFNQDSMLLKDEEIKDDLNKSATVLDELMPRDFSDNRVLNDDLSLSVFNATGESGLANFIGKRLEWAGYSIVSSDSTSDKIDGCAINYGPKSDLNYAFKLLDKVFDCKKNYDDNLNENEAELYFGENYVSMVKYSSYQQNN